ncbi:potassium channel family protein [Streptomyces sp. NPDC051940]|uniref:potassium channel family protein n=1 Tax=Streptomyces sp. NPDC051940 TaxID=3155675 RepID=UPI003445F4D9
MIVWAGVPGVLAAVYFFLPLHWFGPERPVLSWGAFAMVLALIAVLLLKEIRDVLVDRRDTRPAVVIPLLMAATVLTFAASYVELARHKGEFEGLNTRVDAIYFTVVTLATVGYGDIVPRGQAGKLVVLLQILYTFVFLTAGATALTQRVRRRVGERLGTPPVEAASGHRGRRALADAAPQGALGREGDDAGGDEDDQVQG